jgi:O-antigen/teichoic acid export membrane protein
MAVWARPLLALWLGAPPAPGSPLAFQVLLLAALTGLVAPACAAMLDGYGRSDVLAKLYALYTPFNVALVWACVATFGLAGAALAFAARTLLDAVLLLVFAARLAGASAGELVAALRGPLAGLGLLGAALTLTASVPAPPFVHVAATAALLALFTVATWRRLLDEDERATVRALLFTGRR